RVGQLGPVGGGAGVDQGLDVVGDVPDVDVHAGHDLAVGQPEGDVLAAGEVAPDHHVVGLAGADVTGVLHAEVVLVGVEVGQPVVGGVLAEHGAGGDGGLVEGVRPVFDPDVGVEQRVVGAGHVAGGEDVGVGGAERGVHEHAVVDLEPGRGGEPGVGFDADASDDGVGLDAGAVGEADASGDLLDLDAEPQVEAVGAVEVGEGRADPFAEDAQQRLASGLQHGDVDAGGAGGGGHFEADPARADDGDPGGAGQHVAEAFAVVDGAQVEGVAGQAARGGAGGEQQLGVAEFVAGGQGDFVGGAVDGGDRGAGEDLDALVGVPGGVVDEDLLAFGLALQVGLRE